MWGRIMVLKIEDNTCPCKLLGACKRPFGERDADVRDFQNFAEFSQQMKIVLIPRGSCSHSNLLFDQQETVPHSEGVKGTAGMETLLLFKHSRKTGWHSIFLL